MQKLTILLICAALVGVYVGFILGVKLQQEKTKAQRRALLDTCREKPETVKQYQKVANPKWPLPPAENETLFGARIPRTMTLLATSAGSYRVPVKILFYGQSITSTWWTNIVKEELKRRYPHADITVENRAIGGFGAQHLIRTAVHDVYPAYPDLIVYQVYGGGHDRTLEAFVANVRRYTTAEIMLLTHHVRNPHYDGSDEGSSTEWRHVAQKYNCELVEVREEWKQYIKENDLSREQLVGGDLIHLNGEGLHLMAAVVLRHFRYNTLSPGGWAGTVRTYRAKRPIDEGVNDEIIYPGKPWDVSRGRIPLGTSPESPMKLAFEGNRVDIIPGWTNVKGLGTARILIDGALPSENPRLYAVTRPSSLKNMWWPALLRVSYRKRPLVEDWTLRITEFKNVEKTDKERWDHFEFSFEVEGSKTGPDGTGTYNKRFVSDSGRVVIEPRDFIFENARHWPWTWPNKEFEIKWKVKPRFLDVYDPRKTRGKPTTVAMGLVNKRHTIEIVPDGNGVVPINAIRVFRPPLK